MSRCLKTLALLASKCFLTIGLFAVRDATLYSFLHLFVFSIALKIIFNYKFQVARSNTHVKIHTQKIPEMQHQ